MLKLRVVWRTVWYCQLPPSSHSQVWPALPRIPATAALSIVRTRCEAAPHSGSIMPIVTFWLKGLKAAGTTAAEPNPPVIELPPSWEVVSLFVVLVR